MKARRRGDTKATNPKDAVAVGKVYLRSVMPAEVLGEVSLALLEGALKYGRHNYREAGVRASVYLDATARHLDAWLEGQNIDPDSGLSHVTKAIASLVVLRDSMLQRNWVDDRPPRARNVNWVRRQNRLAAKLLERYPDPKPAFTALGQKAAAGHSRGRGRSAARRKGARRS